MSGLKIRILLSAAIAGSMILAGASAASAHDDRHDDRHDERWEREHHHEWDHRHDGPDHWGPDHWRPAAHTVREVYIEPPPRVVYQRPPVMVMPAPVYQVPAYQPPAYQSSVEPSLNFNFTIPLR